MKQDPIIAVALPYSQILELIEAARCGDHANQTLHQAKNTLQRVIRPTNNQKAENETTQPPDR